MAETLYDFEGKVSFFSLINHVSVVFFPLTLRVFSRRFSYHAVHFALYHIYVGTLTIPEHMNIVELAMLCDLFHLDSLKEAVEAELAKRTCHSFHGVSICTFFL